MAVSWTNLPPEIWPIVFKHVESMQSLAECRLVCKVWDPLAERAMFSKPLLSIDGEERIRKFYNRLQENPLLRYCIQSLSLFGFHHMTAAFKKDLLKLILNPNIVSLGGTFDGISLKYMVDAVEESEERCDKLETLRIWEGNAVGSYLKAQYYFRASLRELDLTMNVPHTPIYQNIVDHLDQFSNLRKLILRGFKPQAMSDLERMLRQCQHLESISIRYLLDRKALSTSKDEMKHWMISNVQQSSCLMTADITPSPSPHLVEYLMFKYPNMRYVYLFGGDTADHGSIGRILDAVKNVDTISLVYWLLDNAADVDHALSTLNNKNNVVILTPCTVDYTGGHSIYLNAEKDKDNNTTYWEMSISEANYSAMFNRITKGVASFQNLKVDYTDEDVLLVEDGAVYQGNTAFRRLIDTMTVAVDVCFTSTYISLPSVPVDALSFQRSTTLKLSGAVVDQDVLTFISKTTPNLTSLTLNSCILNPAQPQHYQIVMPHTDLGTLFITSGRPIWENNDFTEDVQDNCGTKYNAAIKKIDSKISIKRDQMVFVKVTCLSSNLLWHYTLEPAGNPAMIKAVSKKKYSACAPGWPNVTIVCKSLKMLKLDLGALMVELKPGIERPVEDTGDWKQTTAAALLNELYNS